MCSSLVTSSSTWLVVVDSSMLNLVGEEDDDDVDDADENTDTADAELDRTVVALVVLLTPPFEAVADVLPGVVVLVFISFWRTSRSLVKNSRLLENKSLFWRRNSSIFSSDLIWINKYIKLCKNMMTRDILPEG